MDEHLVADKHHAGNRHLAQEGGGTQSAHIANVAAHQLHAFPAHLNGVKAQCAPAAHQIDVQNGSHHIAHHGEVGRTVQPQKKHTRIEQCREQRERHKPKHVFHSQWREPFGPSEQLYHLRGK